MLKILLLFSVCCVINAQVINRVNVLNYREYISDVISETVRVVEEREWCNLKLLEITQDVDEQVLDMHLSGTIKYTNGFVVSIQNVNILLASLAQVWTTLDDWTVQVAVRGQLRMLDVALGFDVEADMSDGIKHYTGVITHPLLEFDFSVLKNMHTNATSVQVTGTHPRNTNTMNFLPRDVITDALVSLYDSNSTFAGVTSWATDVFQPIALDVVINDKVPFPGLCYDCPAV